MNSNRNDRSNRGYEKYPEEGYNGGYGTSTNRPYHYSEGGRSEAYRGSSHAAYNTPENLYGPGGGNYSDYSPGYSTANDFSGQEPVRGRLYSSGRRHDDRDDKGNVYRNRFGMHQPDTQKNYEQLKERGYMSEEDYDRGTPYYGGNRGYGKPYGSEMQSEGRYKGKGPRNYRRADNRIQEDINDRLTDDPELDASEIDVAVQNGEVTLTGTVDDREAKRRAEDIAESVSGVGHVENRIKVRLAADRTPPLPVTPF